MKKRIVIILSFILIIILSLALYLNFDNEKKDSNEILNEENCIIAVYGDYEVYDLKIYNKPIFMKENSHELVDSSFQPEWYLGYSAIFSPHNFSNIHSRDEALHASVINEQGKVFLDSIYYKYKEVKEGRPLLRGKEYVTVCSRTIKVRNVKTGKKYLIIPLNSFNLKDGFYMNSETNSLATALSMSFEFDKTIYKSTSTNKLIDLVESTTVYSTILSYMDLNKMVKLKENDCYVVVNNNNELDFNPKEIPKWLFDKVDNK